MANTFRTRRSSGRSRSRSASKPGKGFRGIFSRAADFLASSRAHFLALVAFALLVAVTGGGSRGDIQSLVVLRPLSVLFAAFAISQMGTEQFRSVRVPFLIVAALMAIALLQLVPLPYAMWSGLPGREDVVRLDELAGLGQIARPLSLDPGSTWNTFFALFVPLGAIALTSLQGGKESWKILSIIAAIALIGVVVGILQVLGLHSFYLYRITSVGFPVGLFSNRNHFAMLLAFLIPCLAYIVTSHPRFSQSPQAVGAVAMIIALLLPLVVLTGSRAGVLLAIPAIAIAGWLMMRGKAFGSMLERFKPRQRRLFKTGLIMLVAVSAVLLATILFFSGQATGLTRLFESSSAEEMRYQYLPIFMRIIGDFLPLGSGFGSFETLFYGYEPTEDLTARYMNQAHNDLAQILMEAGILGGLLVVIGLAWLTWSLWQIARAADARSLDRAVFFAFAIAVFLAGSLVDYPLRSPLGAMVFAILTALVGMTSRTSRRVGPVHGARRR